ncbi:hypothetical protein FisN_3Lh300 [Fistulifera solaris]|uniref:Uncharacterized protein n=1 Tax=Fistulifera solaris TaxID=1519565 RepID=A0A1Z5J829_FISSO|nr:hypothetical protein FisN_3Lh300 [Fistulifera solaris]|eukprot:GAX10109.1 hypothetical protein FisN_3Lh300 [Fistulifera solaris]
MSESWLLLKPGVHSLNELPALSEDFLENDLVGIRYDTNKEPRLCAVMQYGEVAPLCIRADDSETDLFFDPREVSSGIWKSVTDDMVTGSFGEGFYGQRPVPSLGGGPGYGAQADELWTVSVDQMDAVRAAGIDLPVLDVGISHGEKARGGSL